MCVCLCPANFKVFARFENCLSKSYRGGEKTERQRKQIWSRLGCWPIHRQHLGGWQPPDREVASFNAGRQLRICVMRGGATAGRGPPARAATGPPSPLLLLLLLLLPGRSPRPSVIRE